VYRPCLEELHERCVAINASLMRWILLRLLAARLLLARLAAAVARGTMLQAGKPFIGRRRVCTLAV
jgi:hypothetical protein